MPEENAQTNKKITFKFLFCHDINLKCWHKRIHLATTTLSNSLPLHPVRRFMYSFPVEKKLGALQASYEPTLPHSLVVHYHWGHPCLLICVPPHPAQASVRGITNLCWSPPKRLQRAVSLRRGVFQLPTQGAHSGKSQTRTGLWAFFSRPVVPLGTCFS